MTRKLNLLSLALVTAMAVSLLAASGAYAAAAKFKDGGHTSVTVTKESHPGAEAQVIETNVGSIECESTMGMYSGPAEATSLTFTGIEYGGCSIAGLEAEVRLNGCDYVLHAGTKTESGSEGTMDVVCPAGKNIEIVASGGLCTVKIPPQTGLGSVKYTNVQTNGKKEEITVHTSLKEVFYSWLGLICGSGSGSNGTYVGTETWRGETTTSEGLEPIDYTVFLQ